MAKKKMAGPQQAGNKAAEEYRRLPFKVQAPEGFVPEKVVEKAGDVAMVKMADLGQENIGLLDGVIRMSECPRMRARMEKLDGFARAGKFDKSALMIVAAKQAAIALGRWESFDFSSDTRDELEKIGEGFKAIGLSACGADDVARYDELVGLFKRVYKEKS